MKIRLVAGAAFAVLAATPVLARPPEGAPGAPAAPAGRGGMMRGPQTRAEVQQMVQDRFAAADANHDGFVTREELDAAMSAEGRAPGGRGAAGRGGNMFDRADANHDGKLTADELAGPFLARFDRADANHDGTISPEEREAARAAMRARWQERRGGGDEAGPPPPQDGGQPQD